MRSVKPAQRFTIACLVAAFLPCALPLPAQATESGYRLLELDGHKVKWGDRQMGVGASVSYAFAGETLRFDDARNCRDMAPIDALLAENLSMETLARETTAAFRVWEQAAGLSFHKVDDIRDADIVLGAQGQPRGRAFANVSYAPDPEQGVRTIDQALVCLNPDHAWKVGFDGDEDIYDIRYTLIHEIGHAIGLDHPGPSGQVMAFRYTEAFDGLQPGDLLGVRALYGRAAGDGGPADGHDPRLSRQPMAQSHANTRSGRAAMQPSYGAEGGPTGNDVIDPDGNVVSARPGDLLALGEKGDTLSCDRAQRAPGTDEGVW